MMLNSKTWKVFCLRRASRRNRNILIIKRLCIDLKNSLAREVVYVLVSLFVDQMEDPEVLRGSSLYTGLKCCHGCVTMVLSVSYILQEKSH
jgi:hypothetical protein